MKKTETLFRTANVASINGSYDKVRNPNRFPTRWGGAGFWWKQDLALSLPVHCANLIILLSIPLTCQPCDIIIK